MSAPRLRPDGAERSLKANAARVGDPLDVVGLSCALWDALRAHGGALDQRTAKAIMSLLVVMMDESEACMTQIVLVEGNKLPIEMLDGITAMAKDLPVLSKMAQELFETARAGVEVCGMTRRETPYAA